MTPSPDQTIFLTLFLTDLALQADLISSLLSLSSQGGTGGLAPHGEFCDSPKISRALRCQGGTCPLCGLKFSSGFPSQSQIPRSGLGSWHDLAPPIFSLLLLPVHEQRPITQGSQLCPRYAMLILIL